MAATKPNQRTSVYSKYTDKDWQKGTTDYYRGLARPLIYYQDADILYKAATGQLNEESYYYLFSKATIDTNPDFKGFTGRIRNYPLIPQSIVTLLAEKSQRPIERVVVAINSDLPNKQKAAEFNAVLGTIQQEFLYQLELQGVPTDTQKDEQGNPIPPESPDVAKLKASNLQDEMSDMGNEFLDYADAAWYIPAKFRDMFFHWCVTGIVVSFKDVRWEELEYYSIPPFQMSTVMSRNISYLEDAEMNMRTYSMPLSELDALFSGRKDYDDIREELFQTMNQAGVTTYAPNQTGFLWSNGNYNNSAFTNAGALGNTVSNPYGTTSQREMLLQHCEVKTEVKVGKLFIDGEEPVDVDESYEPLEGENVEWRWVYQYYQHYVIADMYHIAFEMLPLQRAKWENPFACKSNYNGRVFGNVYTPFQSIVKMQLPYQIQYNILLYHADMLLKKNKDKILVFPYGLIPEKEGMGVNETFFLMEESGILLVDETNSTFANAINGVKVLDASLNDVIMQIYNLAREIKQQCEDISGINAQRKGDIKTSAGLGTTQEAIYRGSLLTEELFKEFDEFQERDYQGILDYSPFICANGKTANYINSDFKRTYKQFWGEDLQQIQFGIKVKSGGDQAQNLKTFKQLSLERLQNGGAGSIEAKILDSTTLRKASQIIEEWENKQAAQAQEQYKAQQAIEERNFNLELEKLDIQTNKNLDDAEYNYAKLNQDSNLKIMEIESKLTVLNKPDAIQDNSMEIARLEHEKQYLSFEIKKHNDDIAQRRKEANDNKELKEKDIQAKKQIARSRPKTSSRK